MKVSLIVVVILLGMAAVVAGFFWYRMGKPLYEPGMVRAGKQLRAPLAPPPQTENDSLWQVEDTIALHHFAAGNGRNVLIVHGGPGYPYTDPWPGLDPLTSDYRFHYYDQRGCGRSTRPIDTFSSNNYYQNMKAVDQALGLGAQIADIERIRRILDEEQLVIIGHSFGAFLAALYAAEFPEHVAALILVAPADVLVMPQESGGLFEAVKQRLPADMHADYDAYLQNYLNFKDIFSHSEADLVALNQEFGRYYREAIDISLPEQGEPGGWMVQAMYLSMGRRHDYRGALGAVQAPVLVIHGAEDLQTAATSRIYVDAFPNARFHIIEGAGHFSFVEQPGAFAQAVAAFLENGGF